MSPRCCEANIQEDEPAIFSQAKIQMKRRVAAL